MFAWGFGKQSYLSLTGKEGMDCPITFVSLWWGPSQDTVQISARLKGVTFWSKMGPHQSPGMGFKARRGSSDTFGKHTFDSGGVVGATSREEYALFSGQTSKKNFGTHQWEKHAFQSLAGGNFFQPPRI